MTSHWEEELAALLAELSTAQEELLSVLALKREMLVANDVEGLVAIQDREGELIVRLQQCHDRRAELLRHAADQGLPCDSLRSLTTAVDESNRSSFERQVMENSARARLLQHHGLTTWVLVQRTLIHLSQILEIIATGGRLKPTYGKGSSAQDSGSLVDRAA